MMYYFNIMLILSVLAGDLISFSFQGNISLMTMNTAPQQRRGRRERGVMCPSFSQL